jgi:hypothetical protein
MEIIGVVLFYGLIFAGIAAMRRWAWADVDDWRSLGDSKGAAPASGRDCPARSAASRPPSARRT